MVQVSSELRRLQEAGSAGRAQEGGAAERVAQLEQQLNAFTQQRLQHLELVQNQQLELQVLVGLTQVATLKGYTNLAHWLICCLLQSCTPLSS